MDTSEFDDATEEIDEYMHDEVDMGTWHNIPANPMFYDTSERIYDVLDYTIDFNLYVGIVKN